MNVDPAPIPLSLIFDCRQGSSDKEYRLSLEAGGGGYVVRFAFGRRGGTLQTGSKTPHPVELAQAKTLFDRLVREKIAKGYRLRESPPTPAMAVTAPAPANAASPPTVPVPPSPDPSAGLGYQIAQRQARDTGIRPQLLQPIDLGQANLLVQDPAWWAQEKYDGKRVLLLKTDCQVQGVNRSGLVVPLPLPVVRALERLPASQCLLDGEALGETCVAFDLLECHGQDLRAHGYRQRYLALCDLLPQGPRQAVTAAFTAMDRADKQALLQRMRDLGREGVVFKHVASPYTPGTPGSPATPDRPRTSAGFGRPLPLAGQVKLKFTATASCLVAGGHTGRRSVALTLYDGSRLVNVGRVAIPARQPIPQAGSIVEVRYLYAFPSGCLFQPVYLGPRDDLAAQACTVAQLKYRCRDEEDPAPGITPGIAPGIAPGVTPEPVAPDRVPALA